MTQPTTPARHVFVYGTLRRGEQRDINRLLPLPRWIGQGSVAGCLYDLGSYPGLRLGGQARVVGEIYAIEPQLETRLDEIEEVWPEPNGEYQKREVPVRLDTKNAPDFEATSVEIMCLVYEASQTAVQGRPLIAQGDWVFYRSGQRT
jgi:gamma-glutamylcyclotransferase (GGCT)/AIG2-like uncharacterized protein YtfP